MGFVSKLAVLHTLALIVLLSGEPVVCLRQWKWSKGKKVAAGNKDLVTGLPGQPSQPGQSDVNFRHYAGYVTVNETNGRALFYWFYEATTSPDEKPLVLWLNGGPGCSSVGYGATQEIGPFIVDTDGNGLKYNSYSWSTEANMLFLESPVGVGFSYSNTTSDYANLGDDFAGPTLHPLFIAIKGPLENIANDAYVFLHKWFLKFPSYRNRTFFIAGESYAGKYVPELAELIHDKNDDPSLHINIQGILLGNPETSDADDWRGLVDYAWSHAIISDETHGIIKKSCDFDGNDTWSNKACGAAVDELLNQYKEIDIYSLYTSTCSGNSTSSDNGSMKVMMTRTTNMMPRIMGGYDPCLDEYAKSFYNRPDVQKALHVSDGQQLKNWSICNMDVFYGWSDTKKSVLPIYKKLIAAGLRIWVYSGDTDGRVPVLSTRYSLSALGLPITKPWRPWYHQREVSGWFQEYDGLMFATFRGAGHAVPCFKPSNSLAFFSAFLLGESPPTAR